MMKSPGSIFVLLAMLAGNTAVHGNADPQAKTAELQALLPGLQRGQIETLLTEGELSNMIDPSQGPLLVPGNGFTHTVTADLQSIYYTIGVEVLNVIPGEYEGFDMVSAANLLLELSTLEGLEYYSASRERMRTLFLQSYAITCDEGETPTDDPSVNAAPAKGAVAMFQEDMTFGKNKLKITYEVTQSTIHMITENITTFSWGPIPLIRPGCLRLHALIYKGDNLTLYYGNFGAKALRIGVLERRIYNSFYNRLVALYAWFQAKLPEATLDSTGGRIH